MKALNNKELHFAKQWWGAMYDKQYDLLHKYYDSEHIIDVGYQHEGSIYNIWNKENKPRVKIISKQD